MSGAPFHLYPFDEVAEHDYRSTKCFCDPVLIPQWDGRALVVHRSEAERDDPRIVTEPSDTST